MCTRRKKGGEVENEDASSSRTSSVQPVPRSEGSVDGGGGAATNRGTPEEPHHREIEVQTNITIRQMVQEVSMGERRRSNAPPAFRKGRKSQLPAAEHPGRSVSRNSSASTPGPRASSTGPRASSNGPPSFRNAFVQTNVRFDLEKDDLVVMRVDVNTQQYHRAEDLEFSDQIVINEETCKEIAAENADAGENTVEMGKRASKVDGRREMTMIVESEDCITQNVHIWSNREHANQSGMQRVKSGASCPCL
uniref:Uncharacterized protein n=1 Tax=Caenorhabditis japonica TaxID=281687 RepID=A0A8R1HHC9_CAEJA